MPISFDERLAACAQAICAHKSPSIRMSEFYRELGSEDGKAYVVKEIAMHVRRLSGGTHSVWRGDNTLAERKAGGLAYGALYIVYGVQRDADPAAVLSEMLDGDRLYIIRPDVRGMVEVKRAPTAVSTSSYNKQELEKSASEDLHELLRRLRAHLHLELAKTDQSIRQQVQAFLGHGTVSWQKLAEAYRLAGLNIADLIPPR